MLKEKNSEKEKKSKKRKYRKTKYKKKNSNIVRNIFFIFLGVAAVVFYIFYSLVKQTEPAEEWFESQAKNTRNISLPKDEGYHPVETEWWKYTGHLVTESGKSFDFYLSTTFLLNNMLTHTVIHSALNDHQQGRHYTIMRRVAGNLSIDDNSGFEFKLADWLISGSNGKDRIKIANNEFSLDLHLASQQAPVFHGNDGVIYAQSGGSIHYFSRTRMRVTGELEVNNIKEAVKGTAWFDHLWGDFTTVNKSWDWFNLQLDDGIDLMLYQIRGKAGTPVRFEGSITEHETTQVLKDNDFVITPRKKWRSEKTGIRYPVIWDIKVPKKNIDITITSITENSEIDARLTTYNVYWEGGVKVEGTHTGKGFMELSGYSSIIE
jgi:predicted secreted hydrolase